jgi:LacI family transcriptional regulator
MNTLTEKVTIKHIAEIAGVSVSTVSRALRNHPTASEKTTKRILEIAKDLNYFPDSLAKSMREKRTGTIGIVLNDLMNPFNADILAQIGEVLHTNDYAMLVCYSNWDTIRERKNILSLLSRRVDGVIISPVAEKSENIQLLLDNNIETVIIDCYPFFKNISYVYTDHGTGGIIATEYLIKNGHRDILLFTGPIHSSLENNFVSSYLETLKKHTIEANDEYIVRCKELSIACGYDTFKRLIVDNRHGTILDCSGIVTICDTLAIGIYKAANEVGLNIPGNYSVIGYDNIDVSSALSPPLTTIHQTRKEIGSESVKLLLHNIIEDHKEQRIVTFKPRLVVRGSVRRL